MAANDSCTVDCPACKSTYVRKIATHKTEIIGDVMRFCLYECKDCGLEFWHPRRVDSRLYEGDVFGLYSHIHEGASANKPHYMSFLRRARSVKQGRNTLLDVGCGDGSFLLQAYRIGFDVWGIDFDRKSVTAARNKGLFHVEHVSLEDFVKMARKIKQRFDIITMFEVLEHQADPILFITQVRDLLKRNGMIGGTVPNSRRYLANLDRANNVGDYPPHHFLWWSKDSLKKFLKSNGFGKVMVISESYFEITSLSGWWATVIFHKLFGHRHGQLISDVTRSGLKSKAFRYLCRIFCLPLALLTIDKFKSRGEKLYFEAVKEVD